MTGEPGIDPSQIRTNANNPHVGMFGPDVRTDDDGSPIPHWGLDINCPSGNDVYSAAPGVVSFAGQATGYGNVVYVNHGDGLQTRYAHLSDIDVDSGDQVDSGDVVGQCGTTGNAEGLPVDEQHLHFEVRQNDNPQNPTDYLNPEDEETDQSPPYYDVGVSDNTVSGVPASAPDSSGGNGEDGGNGGNGENEGDGNDGDDDGGGDDGD